MQPKKKNEAGYSLIELIIVMAVLALLSGTIASLISSGGTLFSSVHNNYNTQSEARTAMAYITVKIRQNDVSNGIHYDAVNRVLQIKKPTSGSWWICFDDIDALKEKETNSDLDPFSAAADNGVIAQNLTGVTFAQNGKSIDVTVRYIPDKKSGTVQRLDENILLRSD